MFFVAIQATTAGFSRARLDALMREKGLNKKQFAEALGKRPNEITRWLSGEHNFTISTLAMLSTFFGQPIINVG